MRSLWNSLCGGCAIPYTVRIPSAHFFLSFLFFLRSHVPTHLPCSHIPTSLNPSRECGEQSAVNHPPLPSTSAAAICVLPPPFASSVLLSSTSIQAARQLLLLSSAAEAARQQSSFSNFPLQ